jgi:hypothetical protein
MSKIRNPLRRAVALTLTAALLGTSVAQADQIFSTSQLIEGTSVISSVNYQFNVSGPGTLSIDLQDLTWPTSLSDLSFTLSTASTVIGQFSGAGTQTFNIASGGTLYAYVTGEASNPSVGPDYGVGLYTLSAGFTPVPLPAALSLMLSALLGAGLLHLRFSKQHRFLSAPPQSV